MNTGVALYYPYIHILNRGWLKQALLYWDYVRRIVPDGFPTHDDSEIQHATEAELLRATSPKPYLKQTAKRIKEKIPALVEQLRYRGESLAVEDTETSEDLNRHIHLKKLEDGLSGWFASKASVKSRENGWSRTPTWPNGICLALQQS